MVDGSFTLPDCPVFLICGTQDESGANFLKSPIKSGGTQVGTMVMVFSNEAKADQFRDGFGQATAGYISMPTDNFFVLRRWFTSLEKNGVTHVNVDPIATQADSGHIYPIGPIAAFFRGELAS